MRAATQTHRPETETAKGCKLFWPFALYLLAPAFFPAHAADPCAMTAKTQAELDNCGMQRYEVADAALNRIYNQVVANMDKNQKAKLKHAQRSWITFRDANCRSQAFDYYGVSSYSNVYTICLANATHARTEELKQIYLEPTNIAGINEKALLGDWRTLESGYGMHIAFGIDKGVHHYLSRLNGLPFEAGQWRLDKRQLTITASNGNIIHFYKKVYLEGDVLSLHEQDGGIEKFEKVPPARQ
ncbi:MAG: DUF1311 domain-containing protein [Gammaproteobacteria bacterium]|nr:DUF1311 domain-containing protein [Gammaproteobacteria bacterium]